MKFLMSVYGIFLGLFLLSYAYFVVKTDFAATDYLLQDFVFMVAWLFLIIALRKGNQYEGEKRGQIYTAMVYGVFAWGTMAWIHFSIYDVYGILLPLIGFCVGTAASYFLHVRLAAAHSFLLLFCLLLVVLFFQTEGVFGYKFMVAFGAEGARETISSIWFALILTYLIQVIFVKIRDEKRTFSIPRYGIVQKDEPNTNVTSGPVSTKPTPIKQDPVKWTPPLPKGISIGVKKIEEIPTKVNGQEKRTTNKKLQKSLNMENFFEDKQKSKMKKFWRDKINKD